MHGMAICGLTINLRHLVISCLLTLYITESTSNDTDKRFSLKDLPALKKFEIPSLHHHYDMRLGRKYKNVGGLYDRGKKRSSHWDVHPDVNIREIDYEEDAEKIKLDHNYKAFVEDEEPFMTKSTHVDNSIFPETKKDAINPKLNEGKTTNTDDEKSKKKNLISIHKNYHSSPLLADSQYQASLRVHAPLLRDHVGAGIMSGKRNIVGANFESKEASDFSTIANQEFSLPVHKEQNWKRNTVTPNNFSVGTVNASKEFINKVVNKVVTSKNFAHLLGKSPTKNKHSREALKNKIKHKYKARYEKSESHVFQKRSVPTFGDAIRKARLAISNLQNKQPLPIKHMANYLQHPNRLMKMTNLNGMRSANSQIISSNHDKASQQKEFANSEKQAMKMLKSSGAGSAKNNAGTRDEIKIETSPNGVQGGKVENKIAGKLSNQIKQPSINPAVQQHLDKPNAGGINNQLTQRTKIESPQNNKISKDKMKIVPANVARAVAMAMEQLRRDRMWGKVFVHVLPSGKLKVMVQETKKMPDD